jgi:hypothetical protein
MYALHNLIQRFDQYEMFKVVVWYQWCFTLFKNESQVPKHHISYRVAIDLVFTCFNYFKREAKMPELVQCCRVRSLQCWCILYRSYDSGVQANSIWQHGNLVLSRRDKPSLSRLFGWMLKLWSRKSATRPNPKSAEYNVSLWRAGEVELMLHTFWSSAQSRY